MAIRVMQKGDIKCDSCGKLIATIKTTKDLMTVLETEAKYTEIRCMDCSEKPLLEDLEK